MCPSHGRAVHFASFMRSKLESASAPTRTGSPGVTTGGNQQSGLHEVEVFAVHSCYKLHFDITSLKFQTNMT